MTYEEMVDQALQDFGRGSGALREIAEGSDRRTTLVYALDVIRAARRTLSDIERETEEAIAAASDDRQFDVEEVGRVEIRRSTQRVRWDHEGIVKAFAAAYSDQTSVPPDSIMDVIDTFRDCVSTGAAKKKFVEFTGHDLDEFSEVKQDRLSVKVVSPDPIPRRLEGF